MRGTAGRPGRPRWLERYPWVVGAWSNRLVHAAVAGVVVGLITWRVALAANASDGRAAATGAVVGLLLGVNYGFLVLAIRRNPNFHAEHPWGSAMTFVVPLTILVVAYHYARGEASLVPTLLSAGVVLAVGGVFWRFLNPLR